MAFRGLSEGQMKTIPKLFASVSLVALVIAANLSAPPPEWLVIPAWLVLAAVLCFWVSNKPMESPSKQAFAMMVFPLLFMSSYLFSPLDKSPVKLLLTEPSLAHLFLPRPFLVLAIIYLGLLCVFLSKKIQDSESTIRECRERQSDLRDTLAGKKALDIFTDSAILDIDIERLTGDIRDYKRRCADVHQ